VTVYGAVDPIVLLKKMKQIKRRATFSQ